MIEAELPDGTVLEFPEGTSQDVIQRVVKSRLQPDAPKPSFGQMLKQEVMGSVPVQAALGAVRGLGDIGTTLRAPFDFAEQGIEKLMGAPERETSINQQRRQDVRSAVQSLGGDESSLAFMGGQILPGAVAGGGIAAGAGRAAAASPMLSRVSGLPEALRTMGMSGGNIATRVGAGAATGAASAGLVNPEESGTGAMIGGAIPMVGPAFSALGELTKKGLGATTGVGDEAIGQAFQAGRQGGQAGQQFTQNMRGQAPMDEVLTMAKQNLQAIGQQRQQAYRSGMANIKADKSVLDFSGIDQAIKNAQQVSVFKGRPINDKTAQVVQQVSDEVAQWRSLDPTEYHTPEGLDALKQRIGGFMESLDPQKEGAARKAVGEIYNSVKAEISKQAPEYSKVMRDYSEATELIREIERTLSLGQKASADTAMRKLQSLMRNNVNTSYGFRDELAQQLQQAGGQNIMPSLAGQAMSDFMPRGIQRATAGTGGAGLAITGNIPAAAALAAISSPRLVGEGAYLAGQGAGMVNPALVEALRRGGAAAAPVIGAQ